VAGVDGKSAVDYFAARDTAFTPDVTLAMPSVGQSAVFGGAGVLDAVRFWLVNPGLDEGYALQLAAGATQETKFHAGEEELKQLGPVLTITYALPATTSPPPPEVSAPPSGAPLLVAPAAAGDLTLSFQDLGGQVGGYNV